MTAYDPAALVRKARIALRYRFDLQTQLDRDAALQCFTCGFRSALPGTPVFTWRQADCEAEPPVIELCEICNAAANAA